ncbi:MAG: helix-turn-helix domain-containing protein [Thermodesulfobacteriota bacterium]|nr:MAG: helix-turn-helix domain-containing protein [Thermodesulfobacteriota bacterium]
MLEQKLKNLGLIEKEAIVYLASLELGLSTIQEIAGKSQISRSTTYEVIESLMKKGLMSSLTKGKKKYFAAEDPERLLSFIDTKERELKKRKKEIKTILPELKELSMLSRERPRIKFYEGKQGIRRIQEDILRTKNLGNIEEFVPLDDAYQLFPAHPRDHRHWMGKKIAVPERMIYTSKKGAILPQKKGPIETLFIPVEKFPFHTEITIYADKVALVSFGRKLIGVVLESEDAANTLRSLFNLLWEELKKKK